MSGDRYWDKTVLLLNLDGNSNDEKSHAFTEIGTVSYSAAKFGSGLTLTTGDSGLQSGMSVADFAFGTGDFTLECWINPTTPPNDAVILSQFDNAGGASPGWQLLMTSAGILRFYQYSGGGTYLITASGRDLRGAWHHVAVTRVGTILRMFIDGVLVGAATNSTNFGSTNLYLSVGYQAQGEARYPYRGQIDEVRLTKGRARYTSDFAPIKEAFSKGVYAPTDPAHRYWRIFATETSGSTEAFAIGELEFRATVGGTDLTNPTDAVTAAFALSSVTPNNTPDKAFNNIRDPQPSGGTNYWTPPLYQEAYTYIGYDFGVGNEVDVNEVEIYPSRGADRQPKSFYLQYSDDNIDWYTKGGVYNQTGWVLGTARAFDFTPKAGDNYAIFRDDGTFTVPAGVTSVDVVVVAGGGGGYYKPNGNVRSGGGGGAGGVVYQTGFSVTPGTSIPVIVGIGGTEGKGVGSIAPTNGGNSSFDTLVAVGGGAAGGASPKSGGSGGGGDRSATAAAGTSGQGNSGGVGTTSDSNAASGGGGGYSTVGGNTTPTHIGGVGGSGLDLSTTTLSAVVPFKYVAGGGAGGNYQSDTYPSSGGSNSGGRGGTSRGSAVQLSGFGVDNTGGGGGGSGSTGGGAEHDAGRGGRGVVIVMWGASDLNYSYVTQVPILVVAELTEPTADPSYVTQVPVLVIEKGPRPAQVTQLSALVLYLSRQPTRVTQASVLALNTKKPIPLPNVFVPEAPVTEVLEWFTTLAIKVGGKEQRNALRKYPRVQQSFNLAIDDGADRRGVFYLLTEYLKQNFIYPLYQYSVGLTAASSAGSSSLSFDTSKTNVFSGEILAVFDPHMDSTQYVNVLAVSGAGVTLTEPLSFDVPVTNLVCGTASFRLDVTQSIQSTGVSGEIDVTMTSTEKQILTAANSESLETFDGMYIVPGRQLDTADESLTYGTSWLDNKIGQDRPYTERRNVVFSGKRTFVANTRSSLMKFLKFFDFVRGSWKPFLIPTYLEDINISVVPALNSDTLTSDTLGYSKIWLANTWRRLRFETKAGVKYRRVLDVVVNYDETGTAVSLSIQISSALGASADDNNISKVSFVNVCRIRDDRVTLEHSGVSTTISFDVQAVNE